MQGQHRAGLRARRHRDHLQDQEQVPPQHGQGAGSSVMKDRDSSAAVETAPSASEQVWQGPLCGTMAAVAAAAVTSRFRGRGDFPLDQISLSSHLVVVVVVRRDPAHHIFRVLAAEASLGRPDKQTHRQREKMKIGAAAKGLG